MIALDFIYDNLSYLIQTHLFFLHFVTLNSFQGLIMDWF